MSETNNTPAADAVETQPTATSPSDVGTQTPPADTAPAGGDLLDTEGQKTTDGEPAGDLLSDDGTAQQEGVPDQYTFEPPEGLDPKLIDEVKLDAFKDKAKELGVSQKQFQGILEYYAERTQASMQEAVDVWNTRVDGWREAARADKEVGGETFDANVKTALTAVEKFGDADFKALLKSPSESNPEGLAIGNHPAVLRFLNRIGKALGDPSLVQGDAQKKDSTDEARLKRLYPSMFKESA